MKSHDYNKDGEIGEHEAALAKALRELAIKEEKLEAQEKMAWFCLILICCVTVFLFTPVISDSRIEVLSDVLSMFYIACSGIAGAYVGVTAWMSRKL